MNRDELENHRANYHARVLLAKDAEREANFIDAVHHAKSAWKFIEGMIDYELKYQEQTVENVDAIELVLQYAPVVFDLSSLTELDAFLKEHPRIARHTRNDFAGDTRVARKMIRQAGHLWSRLESEGKIEANPAELTPIAEAWREMGVVRKVEQKDGTEQLQFTTRLDTPSRGKCPECGAVVKGTKSKMLEELRCPHCFGMVQFVFVDPYEPPEIQER